MSGAVAAAELACHREPFNIRGTLFSAKEILERLGPLLTEERRARIDEVIAGRTYTIVPVVEGLYDRGNVSAVIRSAEALGYQALHVVDTSEKYKEANRITQGADKWLDVVVWKDTLDCVRHLKRRGYRVAATCFEGAVPLDTLDWRQPTALVFGNERDGVSERLLDAADDRVMIPMTGFSRSFNISVAAALALYHLREARNRSGGHGDLDPATRRSLTASYYLRALPAAHRILLNRT